jgi:4-alpha-glucanotransferase
VLSAELAELAAYHGVATEFWDWQGRHVAVAEPTIIAVLQATGVSGDLADPAQARVALERAWLDPWRDPLPPCTVLREGAGAWVWAHVPHGDPVDVWVELEDGRVTNLSQVDNWVEPRWVDGELIGEATFYLPADLPLGWHRLKAWTPGRDTHAEAALIVTPNTVRMPPPPTPDTPHVGTMVQLYSLRSRRSWGLGDLADLADLAAWSRQHMDASFVLINPLHAAEPVPPMEPSPYLPSSRRFTNPIYLRVEEVPEWAYLQGEERAAADRLATEGRRLTSSDRIDRDAVWAVKRAALELVYGVARGLARQAAYEAFLAREGRGLVDFATWCALTEKYGPRWRDWPSELQDPRSSYSAEAREELADRVDFYCWLQWLLDEQLAAVQRRSSELGMALGIMHDLAVGVHMEGADSWALQDVFAEAVSVGAPPDAFNQRGQRWQQPPWRPDRLARTSYAAFRDLVRDLLRHAGGIRVDHVIGLFRLWWVPDGLTPDRGTYVRYDHEALVGILALEAARAGAVVVGEDLGTVEPWVRDDLRGRGILGTSILWFERDWEGDGRPRRLEDWRELCLATVTTHDLPPTAGYLGGEHIRVRDELGLLTRTVEEERTADLAEQRSWLDYLAELGLLTPETDSVVALHRCLRRTPARLIGVSVADLVRDRRTINQPGTIDEYPNWRVPLADARGRPVLLEDLVDHADALALATAMREPSPFQR